MLAESYDILVGHYGSGNFGDDIMLMALVNEYRESNKNFKVLFFGDRTAGFELKTEEFVVIDRSKKLNYLLSLIDVLRYADNIIWGGGTCFTDEEGDGYFIGMTLAYLMNVKVNYRSIGVGDLKKRLSQLKFSFLMKISSRSSFRENVSFHKCKAVITNHSKISIEEDLGEQFFKKYCHKTDVSSENYVLVAWRDLSAYGKGDATISEVASLINHISLQTNVSNVVVIDVDDCVDKDFNDKLTKILCKSLDVKRCPNLNFAEKMALISKSSLVITARLHVMLASTFLDKKVYVYPYSPKIGYAMNEHNSAISVNPYIKGV